MKKENNNFFENLFVLFLICEPLNQALKLIIGVGAQFIFPVIYLILILLNIKKIKNTKVFFLFLFFFIASLMYSIIGYRNHLYNFFGLAYLILFTTLPWLLVGLNTTNIDLLFKKINSKLLYILISNVILIAVCLNVKGELVGNMEISYSILPLAVFSLYNFFKSKKILSLLIFLVSLFAIVSFGSRGPLLCILFFIFIFLIMNIKKHKLLFGLFIILSMFIFFNFQPLLHSSINFLNSHGIQSRTLRKLRDGGIADDTGRSRIHDVTFDLIENNGVTGVGFGVERITINEEINNMNKDMSSCYPHNLFLEIIVQYGWFIGGALCLGIIFLFLKSILVTKGAERDLIFIIMSVEFVRLMISSSYVVSILLFYLIGLCIRLIKERKVRDEKRINDSAV